MGRRRSTAALMAGVTLLSLVLATRRSRACDCSGPDEPFEELVAAAQVFEAELLYELPQEPNADECPWQVKMLRAWKGTTTKKDEPINNSCWCAKPGLEAGKRYIFYTSQYRDNARTISMCSRVVPIEKAAADLAELGEPKEVRAPGQPLPVGKPEKKQAAAPAPLRRWRPSRFSTCAVSPAPAAPASTSTATAWWLILAAFIRWYRRRHDV